ncbi:hypothetical protein WJX73_004056 [Symbiochloris irregularis]|uniref:Uncharacterized protein n=1 Tax=Symbiochloris irregularis TaxID=706552 RepID=A0AAW1NML0_9CHLO
MTAGEVRSILPRSEASSGSGGGGSPVIGRPSASPRFAPRPTLCGLPLRTLMGRSVILGSFVFALMLTLSLAWPSRASPPTSTHGMWEGDGCDYLIIVQQGDGVQEGDALPKLPPNARYTFHENKCFDWGTFGWAIETGEVDPSKYKYIIFMNSSVRGPFLPPYWPDTLHWSHVLTGKLTDKVKIVGATISCEKCWLGGNTQSTLRHNPHVQSYFMATDQVGLKILQSAQNVFKCYEEMWDTIYYSEVGSSLAILNAGYTIDSLMLRYKGLDWRNQTNWSCNNELNPYAEYAYDGITLNPMEVIFPKVKGFHLDGEWTTPRMAATYDRWMTHQGETGSVNSNDYSDKRSFYRLGKMLIMSRRGSRCFDAPFYRQRSHDLPAAWPESSLWIHFVHDGQFEGRPFRFTCPSPFLGSEEEVEAAIGAAMSLPQDSVDSALERLKATKAAAEAAAQHAAAEAADVETANEAMFADAAAQTLAKREEVQRQLSAISLT